MQIVERVDFEIYLFDQGNNFVMDFNGIIAGQVLHNTDLLENCKAVFKDTYFEDNFNFLGCFIALGLEINCTEDLIIKIKVNTISL